MALLYFKSREYHLILLRVLIILEFVLLSVYYKTLLKSSIIKSILQISAPLYAVFSFLDFFMGKKNEFDFLPLVIECLFFTIIILYFFYELMQDNVYTPIYLLPAFWVSLGFLIYFSGNFFLFLYTKSYGSEIKYQFTIIYSFVTILKDIVLCCAVIAYKQFSVRQSKAGIKTDIDLGNISPFINQRNP